LHDAVEVVGHYRSTPLLRFLGKAGQTSDMVGEKLTAAQAEGAMQAAWIALGLAPQFAQLISQRNPPGYTLRVFDQSLGEDQEKVQRLRNMVEGGLEANPAYRYALKAGQLAPLRVATITATEARSLIELQYSRALERGGRLGDIKMRSIVGEST
jgi:hypothetical protein